VRTQGTNSLSLVEPHDGDLQVERLPASSVPYLAQLQTWEADPFGVNSVDFTSPCGASLASLFFAPNFQFHFLAVMQRKRRERLEHSPLEDGGSAQRFSRGGVGSPW